MFWALVKLIIMLFSKKTRVHYLGYLWYYSLVKVRNLPE
ncbi:hypothetical protein GLYMA_04G152450v4 [Glycine max]|nr:hypothetical protein GLYMA_04G152450v4 [Glycine max]KAH1111474.1 hypothetical protein GYH30_010030 [Glycine max]